MALVAHTIVSRHTPQRREPIAQSVANDSWQTETSFGPAQHLHSRPAPSFVAASLEYDEYGMPKPETTPQHKHRNVSNATEDVSSWYRSLRSKARYPQEDDGRGLPSSSTLTSSIEGSSHHTTPEPLFSSRTPFTMMRQTTSWFTSDPRTAGSEPNRTRRISKPSAFADLLSRNPPPLPSEPAFEPPVYIALGLDNKGFTMLQQKGWREGEGLGSAQAERRSRAGADIEREGENDDQRPYDIREHKASHKRSMNESEHATSSLVDDTMREVIDLTHSDSEIWEEYEVANLTSYDRYPKFNPEFGDTDELFETLEHPSLNSHRTMLLTPIATRLKADRLGIGLKAKGSTRKAVTHTSSALAAHIRSGNQMRKEKARHGRGSRGFTRSRIKEERERIQMLAYMNS